MASLRGELQRDRVVEDATILDNNAGSVAVVFLVERTDSNDGSVIGDSHLRERDFVFDNAQPCGLDVNRMVVRQHRVIGGDVAPERVMTLGGRRGDGHHQQQRHDGGADENVAHGLILLHDSG